MKNLVTHALQFASSEYLPVPNTSNMSCIKCISFCWQYWSGTKKSAYNLARHTWALCAYNCILFTTGVIPNTYWCQIPVMSCIKCILFCWEHFTGVKQTKKSACNLARHTWALCVWCAVCRRCAWLLRVCVAPMRFEKVQVLFRQLHKHLGVQQLRC